MFLCFQLKAEKRDLNIKLDTLRKSGVIPAVFMRAGQKTTSISFLILNLRKFTKPGSLQLL